MAFLMDIQRDDETVSSTAESKDEMMDSWWELSSVFDLVDLSAMQ